MELYEEYPEIYDKLYGEKKDYEREAEKIRAVLPDNAESVVIFGCGTGRHDAFLSEEYDVTGVDVTKSTFEVAMENNPDVSYQEGDIRTVSLDETFDAALCLFTVINYLADEQELEEAVRTMASHLKDAGCSSQIMEM